MKLTQEDLDIIRSRSAPISTENNVVQQPESVSKPGIMEKAWSNLYGNLQNAGEYFTSSNVPSSLKTPMQNPFTPTFDQASWKDGQTQNSITKLLNTVFIDNPVARTINLPFAYAARAMIGKGKYLDNRVDDLGFSSPLERQDALYPIQLTGSPVYNKISDVVGTFAGENFIPGANGKVLGSFIKGTENIIGRALPGISDSVGGRVLKNAIIGGAIGVPTGAAQSLYQSGNMESMEKGAITGGILGAGLGVVGSGIGEFASSIVKKYPNSKVGEFLGRFMERPTPPNDNVPSNQKPLELPAPQKPLELPAPREGKPSLSTTPDFYVAPDGRVYQQPEQIALPRPGETSNVPRKTKSVWETVNETANNRMTPPLENKNELAKWVHYHLGMDNLSLNEVRKLSYEDLRQMAEMMQGRLNRSEEVMKAAREFGYGSQYDSFESMMRADAKTGVYVDRIFPETKVQRVEKPNVIEQINEDIPTPKEKPNVATQIDEIFKPKEASTNAGMDKPNPEFKTFKLNDGKGSLNEKELNFLEERLLNKIRTSEQNIADGTAQSPEQVRLLIKSLKDDLLTVKEMQKEIRSGSAPKPNVDVSKPNNTQTQTQTQQQGGVESSIPFKSVLDALDEAESKAWERINNRSGGVGIVPKSSNIKDDLENLIDYSTIMASKLAKGTIKVADFADEVVKAFGEKMRPHADAILEQTKEIVKQLQRANKHSDIQAVVDNATNPNKRMKRPETIKDLGFDPDTVKDLSNYDAKLRDTVRNLEFVMGKEAAKPYLNLLFDAKKSNIDYQEKWLKELKTKIVDGLGIKKNSDLSALVQKYGEGKNNGEYTLEQLKKDAPKDWEKVVEADKFFRNAYDSILKEVNKVRMEIYNGDTRKLITPREDYYRHFEDLQGMSGLRNVFKNLTMTDLKSVNLIAEQLLGNKSRSKANPLKGDNKEKTRFASFMQKRIGKLKPKEDAVGGFLNYLPSASYAVHIDPNIEVFRDLAISLNTFTKNKQTLPNFIKYLDKFADDLQGKENDLDQVAADYIGRFTLSIANIVNNRVKKNMVLGSARSLLAQLGTMPGTISYTKQHALKGAGETLLHVIGKGNTPIEQSPYLKERFFDSNYREFNTSFLDKPEDMAIWLMETVDKAGTYFAWNSAYTKAIAKNIPDPIAYADDIARRSSPGRGIGEMPLIQKSKVFQLIAPFQLDVANHINIMRELGRQKDISGLALLFATSYAINEGYDKLFGGRVVFDPVKAMLDASKEDLTIAQRAGRVAGEVIANVPLGSTMAANVYPRYGAEIGFGIKLPPAAELFGSADPTKYGSGILSKQAFTNPVASILPRFGGAQAKKTYDAGKALVSGVVEKDDQVRFPVSKDIPSSIQSLLFGNYATSEGQRYIDKNRKPLTEKESFKLKKLSADKRIQFYEYTSMNKRLDSIDREITSVEKDNDLSKEEKNKKIDKLRREKKKTSEEYYNRYPKEVKK